MIKVYGVPLSPMVRKVLVNLETKGLEYELETVLPGMTPEGYEQISPLKKIPAFVDDNGPLADSTVICEYLEDRYPEIPLYPSDPAQKARARWIEEYADTILLTVTGANLFFERVVKVMGGMEPDEEKVQKSLERKMPRTLAYLESIAPEQGFLFGKELMMADVAIASNFINARYARFEADSGSYPKFVAYFQRLLEHPAIQKRLEQDAKVLNRA
ncbi:MAG: glutathione S-transferase family protein [Endozoicomonas sp.]